MPDGHALFVRQAVAPVSACPRLFCVLIICIISLIFIAPAANAQTLSKYREKGIESIEDRYVTKAESKEVIVTITDRYYRSKLFSDKYTFKIQLTDPFDEEYTLEVDPVLYQEKHIGDTLSIVMEYNTEIDRYKEKQTYDRLRVKIIE
ncbi:MAG: hypothetical protein PHE26_01050 [Syntrophomonadaceae bacterium]|nr:hypothetical protein [Syntrophomonadaceae bacterium]